jgi:hypothetical protein
VIFSLQHFLSGGTKLSRDYPNKIGKPLLHIFETRKERTLSPDSHSLEIQTLTNFLCSNKIEILNVAGPRESKEPGVYEWTLAMLRIFFNRTASGAGCTENSRRVEGGKAYRKCRILVLMFPGRLERWLDHELPDLPHFRHRLYL